MKSFSKCYDLEPKLNATISSPIYGIEYKVE
jgi:hypothetical protein